MFGGGTISALVVLLMVSILARQDTLFLLALALLVASGLSRLWERYCLSRVEYRRRFSQAQVAFGEPVEVEIEVVNRKPLPLSWLEIEDEIPERFRPTVGRLHPSHKTQRLVLTSLLALRPYERVRRRYEFPAVARGEHILGPVDLRSGDLFGFATREVRLEQQDSVVVYPRVLPLETASLAARHPLGDLRTQSWLFEDPTRVAGARDYRPGDSIRRIHWPASVRAQRLQSKIYEATTSHVVGVFLNLATDSDAGWGLRYDPDVLELSIVAAASLANWALERGYQVGLYTNGTHRLNWASVGVPPGREPSQLQRILLALGRLQPFALGRFDEALLRDSRDLPFGATAVVITAGLYPELAEALIAMRARGSAPTVVLTGRTDATITVPGVALRRVGPPESWRDADSLVISAGGAAAPGSSRSSALAQPPSPVDGGEPTGLAAIRRLR